MDINVLCMKWGTKFPSEHVNKLYRMVSRHLRQPFNFVCFTDDSVGLDKGIKALPLPEIEVPAEHQISPWRKLGMFKPGLGGLTGMGLFLDLDVVIIDDIDCFFSFARPEDFCIIENWTTLGEGTGQSSVYRFKLGGDYDFIYEAYAKDPLAACKSCDNEQVYLSHQIMSKGKALKFWPETWCRSFKEHCKPKYILSWFIPPRIPDGTKIVVFHGRPTPEDALAGRWPGWKFWHRIRSAKWVGEYWR